MDKVIHEPVRMILTEEELNNHLSYIERHKSTIHQEVVKSLLNNIGYSHKALIEANAELSFKINELNKALMEIATCEDPYFFGHQIHVKTARKALGMEELK